MTKIHSYFLLAASLLAAMPATAADTLDSDGFPVMYIRGDQTNSWSVQEQYKFTREGDSYSIHLDKLNGQFKISGTDWQYNIGANSSAAQQITTSVRTIGLQDGLNYNARNLSNVDMTFRFAKSEEGGMVSTPLTIIVDGQPLQTVINGMSGTLPVIYINIYQRDSDTGEIITDYWGEKYYDDEILDKDLPHKNYFTGEYWLDINGCQWLKDLGGKSVGSEDEPLPMQIKARGNYSRTGYSKKPFKLKLDKKQNLLNININGEKSKHWTLLAHADDGKGYLRNYVGFNLGERIGLPWTPRQQPVEVVINGDYRGLYFLTEGIRVGDGRVPVTELDDNISDPELVSGGYVVELDNYDEDDTAQIRMEEKGQAQCYKDKLRITFDTPEEYSELQRRFIYDQFTAINDLIGDNSDEVWQYLDIDDLARYYIVEEIISHVEAFHGSTYLFRDRGEGQKWHFSPLWDCGNAFNGSTSGYFYNNSPYGNTWIPSFRLNDTFNAKVKETWQWFMGSNGGFNGIYDDIDTYCANIAEAAKADHQRWAGQPVPAGGYAVNDNSDMQSRKNEVVRHLQAKINWLAQRSSFGAIGGDYAEPARDTTPAAPLPDYAQSGVEDIDIDIDNDTDSPKEYYDLMGRRVLSPAPGNLYIIRQGATVSKVRL